MADFRKDYGRLTIFAHNLDGSEGVLDGQIDGALVQTTGLVKTLSRGTLAETEYYITSFIPTSLDDDDANKRVGCGRIQESAEEIVEVFKKAGWTPPPVRRTIPRVIAEALGFAPR